MQALLEIDPGLRPQQTEALSPVTHEAIAAPTNPNTLGSPLVGEAVQVIEVDPTIAWNEDQREAHLRALESTGFTDEQLDTTIDTMAAIGLPVNRVRRLSRESNSRGMEDVLGSWTHAGPENGTLTAYELLDNAERVGVEKRFGTYGHELMRANTPFNAENNDVYGGEAERLEAARYVEQLTDQALTTDVHLNGYHKALVGKYRSGEIDINLLREETSAIVTEMALVNRGGLEAVEERQLRRMEDANRILRMNGRPEQPVVRLLSRRDKDGTMLLDGADKTLVKLIEGVNNHGDLMNHIDRVKQAMYSPEAYKLSRARVEYREQVDQAVFERQKAFQDRVMAAYAQIQHDRMMMASSMKMNKKGELKLSVLGTLEDDEDDEESSEEI